MKKRLHVSHEILVLFFDVCEEGWLIVGVIVDFLRGFAGKIHLISLNVVPWLFLGSDSVDHEFVIFKIKVINS